MKMIDINDFIKKNVIFRNTSMFLEDIENNRKELTEKIHNKSVLVIGGAGSIGSSFIKAILPFKPRTLVVVDINENALTELTRDLRSSNDTCVPMDYVTYPMSYSDRVFEKMIRLRKGFDIVANFSAHKHVRSEKDILSVESLLRNNVLDAVKLLDLLSEYPPEVYFCVSTDKAANPVNIMGASKRIMEDLIFSYSEKFPTKTARFANVAFSNGSLPAGFLQRLNKKQPLSAPSDVKRYFVSPEESGHICMLACLLGKNREIFYPKLNEKEMISFDLIAINLLREYGYEPDKCLSDEEALSKMQKFNVSDKFYPVHFSPSDTSGEKMYEEFYTSYEDTDVDRYSSLGVIINKNIPDKSILNYMMDQLEKIFESGCNDKDEVVKILESYLPNFRHVETGKSLDSKM